jgi:hypothetical protein
MTADTGTAGNSSVHQSIGRAVFGTGDWTAAASLSTVAAAVLYAYGWIFMRWFYAAFGVQPEEVGITFAYLVVRVGVIMAILVGMLLGLRWLLAHVLGIFEQPDIRDSFTKVGSGIVALIGAGLSLFVLLGHYSPSKSGSSGYLVFNIGAGAFALASAALGILSLPPVRKASSESWAKGTKTARRVLERIILIVLLVTLLAGLVWIPVHYRQLVESGKDLSGSKVLALVGLDIEDVKASLPSGMKSNVHLPTSCLVFLGSGGETTILYYPHSHTTYRVPSNEVTISAPC